MAVTQVPDGILEKISGGVCHFADEHCCAQGLLWCHALPEHERVGMQDNGKNALVLSQTLPAPGGSNNTDFGRKVNPPQSISRALPAQPPQLCSPLQCIAACDRSVRLAHVRLTPDGLMYCWGTSCEAWIAVRR